MIFDELSIVHKAQRGDTDAFSQLVEAYQGPVYRLILRMGLPPADAEEAAQEAFVSAWRGLPQFRGDSQFSTWLYRLATHTAIDFLRKTTKHQSDADIDNIVLPDTAASPQEQAEQEETRFAVRRALTELSADAREILLLRYMEELSYEEIGTVLKLPPGTVKSRINRAKAQLKTALLRQGNFSPPPIVQSTGKEERS